LRYSKFDDLEGRSGERSSVVVLVHSGALKTSIHDMIGAECAVVVHILRRRRYLRVQHVGHFRLR
jgi:hypothetical protein